MSDRPELSQRVVDESDGRPLGGGDVPTASQKVDLLVGVDATFQMQGQMEIQQCGRRTGTRGGALFRQRFFHGGIGTEARGAAEGGVLPCTLPVEHELCGGITGDFFISQDGHEALLHGSKAAFDLALGLRAGGDQVGDAQG